MDAVRMVEEGESMSVTKHQDTYVCYICGAEFTERRSVNVPVVWTTEQIEGRPCEPYYGVERLDLCEECADRVHVVEAAGAQGLNCYAFRKSNLLRKRCEMASTVKRTVWLVTDHGGEWEDMWDWDICAFTDEKAARECAEKRKERRKRSNTDEFDDYWGTDVKRVTLIESGER